MHNRPNPRQKAQQAWSKRVYLLPNLFTTANMFCGYFSIIASIQGRYYQAAWLLLAAMIFDSMDGRVARFTRSTSDFGLQYDSLSDLVSFGVAPAILAYLWALQPFGRLGWLLSFFYMVCAALRLARFNVMVNVVPKGYFQGLPSPLSACAVATAVLFHRELKLDLDRHYLMIPVAFVVATLMVSSIPFPSFKDFKIKKENSFRTLALVVLVMTLIAVRPEVTIFVMGCVYIVAGLLFELFNIVFRPQRGIVEQPGPSEGPGSLGTPGTPGSLTPPS